MEKIKQVLKKIVSVLMLILTTVGKVLLTVFNKLKVWLAPVKRLWDKFVIRMRDYERKPFIFCVILSFLLYIVVEMLSRRNPVAGLVYVFQEPVVFFNNWLIVMATLSVGFLFKRREFVFSTVSLLWFILGLANCILLGERTTPLNFMDFRTAKDVLSIMTVYFTNMEIVAIVALIALFILIIVSFFIHSPKEKVRWPRSLASMGLIFALLAVTTTVSVQTGSLATTFKNLQDAYKDYGFAYCFACSALDRGVSEPDDYSEESVQKIIDKINANGGNTVNAQYVQADKPSKENPNLVIVQLESFFDVNHVKGCTFSEEPLPNWNYIKDNYTNGYVTMPSFGAGTVNVEFEILSGQSMTNFGPGEYPYTTILRKRADETLAFDLKDYGYSTHAIHNHTGKFYGRYLVYPHEGFDSFTSVEYMQDVERNPLDWADDSILTGEIRKALDSTEEPDFVFAVSVQGHGKYPSEPIDPNQKITVEGFPYEEEACGFEYFTNQMYEMDEFIGELIDDIEKSGEPTILVAYGDHLPKFNFTNDDLENGDIYETEYIMWDNIGLKEQDKDLHAYELFPYLMSIMDKHSGVMNQYHQFCADDPDYQKDLHTLQYDILYGENYAYGGDKDHFQKTDMKMGIDPISIGKITRNGKFLYFEGENFTERSKVFINGEECKTTWYDKNHIMCRKGKELEDGDVITVIQMSSKKTQLSRTAEWTWHPEGAVETSDANANIALHKVESEEDIQEDLDKEGAEE